MWACCILENNNALQCTMTSPPQRVLQEFYVHSGPWPKGPKGPEWIHKILEALFADAITFAAILCYLCSQEATFARRLGSRFLTLTLLLATHPAMFRIADDAGVLKFTRMRFRLKTRSQFSLIFDFPTVDIPVLQYVQHWLPATPFARCARLIYL